MSRITAGFKPLNSPEGPRNSSEIWPGGSELNSRSSAKFLYCKGTVTRAPNSGSVATTAQINTARARDSNFQPRFSINNARARFRNPVTAPLPSWIHPIARALFRGHRRAVLGQRDVRRELVDQGRSRTAHFEMHIDALQHRGQGEAQRDIAESRHGNAAGLFGNDQRQTIRLLGNADGRAVARSQ